MTMKCPGFTILPASSLRSVASVTSALRASWSWLSPAPSRSERSQADNRSDCSA